MQRWKTYIANGQNVFEPVRLLATAVLVGTIIICAALFRIGYAQSASNVQSYVDIIELDCGFAKKTLLIPCVEQHIVDIAHERGLEAAFATLGRLYTDVPSFASACGTVAYAVGTDIASTNPNYRSLELTRETIICNFGFYQAYAEQLFASSRNITDVKGLCRHVADGIGNVSPGAAQECARGAGYALPFIDPRFEGDASEMASFSIDGCKAVAGADDELHACVAGAFRKIADAEIRREHGLLPDRKDPMRICALQEPPFDEICDGTYKYVLIDQIPDTSDSASVTAYVRSLYGTGERSVELLRQVAFILAYNRILEGIERANAGSYDDIVDWCGGFNTGQIREQCIQGMMVSIAKNGTPYGQLGELISACGVVIERFGTDGGCPVSQALGYLKGFYSRKEFDTACKEFESKKFARCEDAS